MLCGAVIFFVQVVLSCDVRVMRGMQIVHRLE